MRDERSDCDVGRTVGRGQAIPLEPAVTILSFALLGGIGTPLAPVLGAWILTLLPELLRGLADFRLVFNGVIIVIAVLFLPNGVLPFRLRRHGSQ